MEEMGGVRLVRSLVSFRWTWTVEEERDTVFVNFLDGEADWDNFDLSLLAIEGGKPDTIGGGRSKPSVAFLDNCRAKSEACHHSRNFRAKIEVGRSSFKLERRRGYTSVAKLLGLKMLDPWPGRARGFVGLGVGGCSARAMTR